MSSPGQPTQDNSPSGRITILLRAWAEGDLEALNQVFPELYEELVRIAGRILRGVASGQHSLNSAELVNEAYIRLAASPSRHWQGRGEFFALACTMIKGILVDHLRSRYAKKRGGDFIRVTLGDVAANHELGVNPELIDLNIALDALGKKWPRVAAAVNLRMFGGCSVGEIASALECAQPTVQRDLQFAKVWLRKRLGSSLPRW